MIAVIFCPATVGTSRMVHKFPMPQNQIISHTKSISIIGIGKNMIKGIEATALEASEIIADAIEIFRRK